MLATGAQVKEHAMSQKLNAAIMLRIIEDLAGDWRRLDARIEGYLAKSKRRPVKIRRASD
jgi:hypothetical protein